MRGLAVAAAAPVALLVTLVLYPSAPWRAPLAFTALIWAPGFTLLALLYPPRAGALATLERHALAAAVGFLAAPALALAASLVMDLRAIPLAAAAALVTVALATAARRRDARLPAPRRPRRERPEPRVRQAASAGAAAAVLLLIAPTGSAPVPAHLALLDENGTTEGVPRALAAGTSVVLTVEAASGGVAAAGDLAARLEHGDGDAPTVLLREWLDLPSQAIATRDVRVPPLAPGEYKLVIEWHSPAARSVHAWLTVVEAGA